MDNLTSGSWAADIIEAAKATQGVERVYSENNTLIVAHSEHQKIAVHDLERYGAAPARIRRKIEVTEVVSFVDYWQRFATDRSEIHADLEARKFRAVLDANAPDRPSWEEHTCTLLCRTSTEWNAWKGGDGHPMDQVKFAEFIETNAIDIIEPSAAEMKEIALTLQAKKKVSFSSGVRLENGQIQLGYHETIEGAAGPKGDLRIPEKFKLALRIFQGGDKYEVEAHLRYRINEGNLTFFYQIIRPERLLEDAFEQVKVKIKTGCQGAQIYAVA